jgi:TolB-like protein/DNA-binding winged helix-turn-helix (wHTH) protein/Flp pilus assembly protein TadD
MSGCDPMTNAYEFGEFRLETARRSLTRRGETVAITGKPFDALVYLLEHAGTVVPREELANALWPSTVVEDNNLSQTILALRRVLDDAADTPGFIATVPRRGYQFIADVRAPLGPSAASPDRSLTPESRSLTRFASYLLAFAAVVGFAIWYASPGARELAGVSGAATPASRLNVLPHSVAVLPFVDLGSSREREYFAAGVHEEVLNQLGRIRGLNVTARTSVLRYAGVTAPVDTIARELGVMTVLEGSVRYVGDRVRVTARLADGATGTELWTQTYDAAFGDVFEIQADIARRIAAALAAEITVAENSSIATAPTESLAAYALYLQALALYRTHGGIGVSISVGARGEVSRHLDEALSVDPNFAAALGWRAQVALDSLMFDSVATADWPRVSTGLMQRVERDVRRALELDAGQGMAHVALARLEMFRGRFADARTTLERALERRASDAVVLHYLAMVASMLDDHAAAISAARRAVEIDPKNPAPYSPLGMALRALGDRAGAVAAHRQIIELAPSAPIGYITLARTEADGANATRILEAVRLAERILDDTTRNFRADAALSYARAGAHTEAERLIREFDRATTGRHVSPGLAAMARLAVRDYVNARKLLEQAIDTRASGMDPMPLLLIQRNSWADPVLDQPDWRSLRARLGGAR